MSDRAMGFLLAAELSVLFWLGLAVLIISNA